MSDELQPEKIYLPPLRYFENKNTFSGSCGMLRFMLKPDPEAGTIHAQIWHGLFCLQKSTVEEELDVPLTEDGREELRTALLERI